MKHMRLRRDGDKDVGFVGELLGKASSKSSQSTRWTEIRIFRSTGGRFITSIVGRTLWEGEVDRFSATICDDDEARVIDSLRDEHGQLGWVAKAALEEAGIDCIEEIE